MKGRTPTRDEREHMDRVREIGCIVCREFHGELSPAEIHHLDGKTKPGAHFKVLPLCTLHHRGGVDVPACTSRHPYKARFEERYGSEEELLELVEKVLNGDGYDPTGY